LEALKNALQSVVVGSTIGGLSFFLMPVAGWYQSAALNAANAAAADNDNDSGSTTDTVATKSKSGLAGLFAGAIAGSITGSIMTILGIVNGSYQVATGVYTTFAAVTAAWQGTHIWDDVAEAWVVYDLQIEMEELSASVYNKKGNSNVREMGYYDLLQVTSNATPKEIKKAYYRLAKELHPDKNPGNDQAAEQFRQLHTVYRILSDDEKRAAYDAYGEKSVDDDSGATAFLQQFDPFTFFAVLFGSQLVETYIGELAMPSVVDQLMKLNPADVSSQDVTDNMLLNGSDYKKRKRQVDISINLLERVRDFVDGNVSKEAFRESCKTEAENIAESPFGEEFLVSIGSTLAWEAGQYVSFSLPILGWTAGSYYFTRKQTRRLYYGASMVFKAVSFVRSAYVAFQKGLDEDAPTPNMTPEQFAQEQVEEMLPEMLELAWSFNKMDISSTLNGVCRRLFADAGADSLTRKKRAEAIQILGKEFLKRGNSNNDSAASDQTGTSSCKATERDAESIKARLEVAFQASLMKVSSLSYRWIMCCWIGIFVVEAVVCMLLPASGDD
jgi:curved DNA-binding protein CbpA